uniref:Uncharacterized protein n=1 Tax=Panagrolaimus davidi TaxID=227884 RepID=A0A914P9R5_9BILA
MASEVEIPVIGYFEERDKNKLEKIMKSVSELQENGIDADWYPREELAGACNTSTLKLAQLKKYHSQTSQNDTLNSIYPNIKIISDKNATERRDEFQRSPTNKNTEKDFMANVWLHVKMPPSFNYTGAIMLNQSSQGLLHTLLRHFDEWAKLILNFQGRINPSLQNQINNIGVSNNKKVAKTLLKKFVETFGDLDDSSLIDLHELEMDIHKYIQNNVTCGNYLGEGCNNNGLQQIYWKIKDLKGNDQILVICVSTQLFPANPDFQDKRKIRTITTVFTKPMSDLKNCLITKLF